jgi:hypothetical protein
MCANDDDDERRSVQVPGVVAAGWQRGADAAPHTELTLKQRLKVSPSHLSSMRFFVFCVYVCLHDCDWCLLMFIELAAGVYGGVASAREGLAVPRSCRP